MAAIIIHGAGGFSLQILDTVKALQDQGNDVCFVDQNHGGDIAGVPIISADNAPPHALSCVAIAGPAIRKKIVSGLSGFITLTASTAIVSEYCEIGEGSILAHHALIEAKSHIGKHFQANIFSYVAHDCTIGDYVTFAPRVNCNGNVTIGDGAYIGTGAILKQGVSVGEGATIGMGAVVTKDVPAGETWVGNPAKALSAKR